MNRGEEDYLKAVYELERMNLGEEFVTNQQLAQHFTHTAQTINEMIRKLVNKKMLEYVPYKGSRLTQEGKALAIRMIRVHRIWETFLVEKLGYTWDEVHDEAEGLEHLTTSKLEERLFNFLGKPTICPHGNTIPGLEEDYEDEEVMRLIDAREGEEYCLKSVTDDKELLVYLDDLGLSIGSHFRVNRKDQMSEIIELSFNGRNIILGYRVAMNLYVKDHCL